MGYAIVGTAYVGSNATDLFLLTVAANGDSNWYRTYHGAGDRTGAAVQPTATGGCLAAGTEVSTVTGYGDVLLLRVNPDGTEAWSRVYGGPANEQCHAMCAAPDGGFLAVGEADVPVMTHGIDILAIRISEAGDTLWTRTYGMNRSWREIGWDCEPLADGGFIILGTSLPLNPPIVEHLYLVRIDAAGDTLWTRHLPSLVHETHSIVELPDGGFLIAGSRQDTTGVDNVLLVRVDAVGELIEEREWGEPWRYENASEIVSDGMGGWLVGGRREYDSTAALRPMLVQFDSAGSAVWDSTFQIAQFGDLAAMACVEDGGRLATGYFTDLASFSTGVWLARIAAQAVAVANRPHVPGPIRLSARPNPFNATATISYVSTRAEAVDVTVYDTLGRKVATVFRGQCQLGQNLFAFDATGLPTGYYFCNVQVKDQHYCLKVLQVK